MAEEVQPGLSQRSSSLAERASKCMTVAGVSSRVWRQSVCGEEPASQCGAPKNMDIGELRADDTFQGIDTDLETQKCHCILFA